MASISWTSQAVAQFSPEELECASRGGMWDRQTQTCTFAQPLPPATALMPPLKLGTVDPQQMFDDGFVYWNGEWVQANDPRVVAATSSSASRPPGMAAVQPLSFVQGGSVLGFEVPIAPAVLLPAYVGGRIGRLELASGTRPASGGTERWIMGDVDQPRLVLG